ncbi:putative nitrate ABC transporter, periplasmic protein [Catellatospora sp. TT07R-123]|uniref:ABC transporter substrate-binding protein n=1 Tax=Catellatospora sp. TT07R-123 TaxID=2733863 RepID=UPI001B2505F8|nr:ABC transporter substrate-binding protein [Catellatospora sp. TT07R-123]GHJ42936.1 putative nitrate ABC transporter, periplasmic protein [Catellatospora sp. TT07R-123]
MRRIAILALTAALTATSGCTVAGAAADGDAERVVVGYQSKTINTVTAGTLLKAQGFFEKRLAEIAGRKFQVVWQDYDTGAPITAQMIAGKIDIGSMGDYPLLINGSRGQQNAETRTKLISATGFNIRGALNMVVTTPASKITSLADLQGRAVSTSVGSAAHGTLVQALERYGVADVKVENQVPQVGASALQAGNVAALSQFVAWPALLVHRGEAQPLYDGGDLKVPTFHGVVVREAYAKDHADVVKAFLKAQIDATRFLWADPLAAAKSVADATGLPPEVVYLYNGAGGQVTFDVQLKQALRDAHAHDVPFLKSIGVLQSIDLAAFVDDSYLRAVYGDQYDADFASTANRAAITGTDEVCGRPVTDPALAGELWPVGADRTKPAATPTCLLRAVRKEKPRAAYVPDATTGTRWFADRSLWVVDPAAPADERFKPFVTRSAADAYTAAHPGARVVTYAQAVEGA